MPSLVLLLTWWRHAIALAIELAIGREVAVVVIGSVAAFVSVLQLILCRPCVVVA